MIRGTFLRICFIFLSGMGYHREYFLEHVWEYFFGYPQIAKMIFWKYVWEYLLGVPKISKIILFKFVQGIPYFSQCGGERRRNVWQCWLAVLAPRGMLARRGDLKRQQQMN